MCDKFELDALSPCVLFNTMNLPLANPNTSGQLVMQWLHAMENDCIENGFAEENDDLAGPLANKSDKKVESSLYILFTFC